MRSFTNQLLAIIVFLLGVVSSGTGWVLAQNILPNVKNPFDVGVILDMSTYVGNISWSSICMAIDDFYAAHPNHTRRLVLHLKDSKEDVVSAASAGKGIQAPMVEPSGFYFFTKRTKREDHYGLVSVALSLLENLQVQAMIGPQTSNQAKFIAELANKYQIPTISFLATSPFLSSLRTPYFIPVSLTDYMQVQAIAYLMQSCAWTELILIFDDSEYGMGMMPYLLDAFQATKARITYHTMISLGATDDQILQELHNLINMETRVFVLHASNSLASRIFLKAKELGMIGEGYAWIGTYGLTDLMDFMDSFVIDAMHGVLTVKPYIPKSVQNRDFNKRWRERFLRENPTLAAKLSQPSIYSMRAYDTAWALAMAAESLRKRKSISTKMRLNAASSHSSGLEKLVARPNGPRLLNSISGMKFKGVSGVFQLVHGQLDSVVKFEIIHIMRGKNKRIGFWTKAHGISQKLEPNTSLKRVMRQGNLMALPKELKQEVKRKKLRIGAPVKLPMFKDFVNKEWNPWTRRNASGFCIEVFDLVVGMLSYNIEYEYIFFENSMGEMNGSYDDLIYQVYLKNFDAVVGDVQITVNRSMYVDFTVQYSEPGMSMVVPIKDGRNAWTFVMPLTSGLWLAIGAFFVYTGFVVWVLEHRNNDYFKGPPLRQLGNTLYFAFSTMVYAHREKLFSNFTRVVVIIWLFVVIILTSSYTASLSSMLTIKQLHPTVTTVEEIVRNQEYIVYIGDYRVLRPLNLDLVRSRNYGTYEEYDEALTKGSSGGGIGAVIAENPYIDVFLSKYCGKYAKVENIYKSTGFGFAFPKGSLLAKDISREIMIFHAEIEKKFPKPTCSDYNNATLRLSFDSFKGLFFMTGLTSASALTVYVIFLLYEHCCKLHRNNSGRTT